MNNISDTIINIKFIQGEQLALLTKFSDEVSCLSLPSIVPFFFTSFLHGYQYMWFSFINNSSWKELKRLPLTHFPVSVLEREASFSNINMLSTPLSVSICWLCWPRLLFQAAPKIFGGDIKSHLLSFFPGDGEQYDGIVATLKKVAALFKGKVRESSE